MATAETHYLPGYRDLKTINAYYMIIEQSMNGREIEQINEGISKNKDGETNSHTCI